MKKLWIFSILMTVATAAMAQTVPPPVAGALPSIGMVALCCALVAVGLFGHVIAKLAELEQRGQPTSWKAYILEKPYTSINVVFSAYGMLGFAYFTGEMGPLGALSFGVAAQSVGDKFRASAEAKTRAASPQTPPEA